MCKIIQSRKAKWFRHVKFMVVKLMMGGYQNESQPFATPDAIRVSHLSMLSIGHLVAAQN
jgi:hypothetical protein